MHVNESWQDRGEHDFLGTSLDLHGLLQVPHPPTHAHTRVRTHTYAHTRIHNTHTHAKTQWQRQYIHINNNLWGITPWRKVNMKSLAPAWLSMGLLQVPHTHPHPDPPNTTTAAVHTYKQQLTRNYPLEEGEHDVLGTGLALDGLLQVPQRLGCGQQGHNASHRGVRAWVLIEKHAHRVHLAKERKQNSP